MWRTGNWMSGRISRKGKRLVVTKSTAHKGHASNRLVPKPCLQTAPHQALQLLLAHLVDEQLERELDERDVLRREGLLQAARQRAVDLPAYMHISHAHAHFTCTCTCTCTCTFHTPLSSAKLRRAAVEKNAIGSLRVLLAAGAKPNQPMNMRDTVVITAIYLGNDECLRILLDARASVEYHMNNGHTPLFIAAANGNGKAVKRLLAAGASANLPCKNDQGMSPLYGAALGGHVKVARALIAGRADLHHATRDEGNAPLFVATTHGHLDVMRCLIEAGASVNHATPLGTTALHGGVFHGSARLQTVQLLLAARADTEAVERHPKGPATAIDNLTIGGFVTIRGLQSRPELNGMEAQVIGTQGDRTKLRAISGVEVVRMQASPPHASICHSFAAPLVLRRPSSFTTWRSLKSPLHR